MTLFKNLTGEKTRLEIPVGCKRTLRHYLTGEKTYNSCFQRVLGHCFMFLRVRITDFMVFWMFKDVAS